MLLWIIRQSFGVSGCFQFFHCHDDGGDPSHEIGDGTSIEDAVDADQHRQSDDQRQKEDDLSCQRQEHSLCRFADGSKEIRGYRLYDIEKSEEQKDPKVTDCEFVVFR